MTIDAIARERLDFAWLDAAIAALTPFGREAQRREAIFRPGDEAAASAAIAATLALAAGLSAGMLSRLQDGLRALSNPLAIAVRVSSGDRLDDVDFYELGRFARALDDLRALCAVAALPAHLVPAASAIAAVLAPGTARGGFYLDDAFAADLAAARRSGDAEAIAAAEEQVRTDLGAALRPHVAAVVTAAATCGALDSALARAAFTQRHGGVAPSFEPGRMRLVDATLPPLAARLARDGIAYAPISLEIAPLAVLTGANMGGKSAALATLGFHVCCVARGIPPPARSARLPLVEHVHWIGPDTETSRTRSLFAGEIAAVGAMLPALAEPTLVLVDEFGAATAPREGSALAIALVERLAERGAYALIATHFDGIAERAGVAHLTVHDYDVVPTADARAASNALATAERLGLDPALVARARALLDENPAG